MTSKALFDVPPGAVAQVSIIDSSLRITNMPAEYLLTPRMEGFDTLPFVPTWSFLVQSSTGQKALFDLGVPPDTSTYAPAIVDKLRENDWTAEAKQHVADILREHGLDPSEIGSVIWSH